MTTNNRPRIFPDVLSGYLLVDLRLARLKGINKENQRYSENSLFLLNKIHELISFFRLNE